MNYFRTKTGSYCETEAKSLVRCLNTFDLTLLGIGVIIGAGIFVITGIAAATKAGPAISISYIIAGLACAFTALAYAELASSIGGCGSAYGYAYASMGELISWIIGWDLILEYSISCVTVAIGWAGYVDNALDSMGIHLPDMLLKGPLEGGFVNILAMIIILLISLLLAIGVKQSAQFNRAMVFIKLLAIAIFVGVAFFNVKISNWYNFMPFGYIGIMEGAALIFFAYIGFDAVSTAAEEVHDPQRTMPIGILLSLGICTTIYVLVASLLTLVAPYTSLNNASPVAQVLLDLGYNFAAACVSAGAIAGLTTVVLVMYFGLTRVFLAMSRDGLLPSAFSDINPKTHTPIRIIIVSGIVMSIIAGLMPMGDVAELVNIGTLSAFVIVCAGVIVLRYQAPDMERPFKTPFSPLIPGLGIVFCVGLMLSLPGVTWVRFLIWLLAGLAIYFFYGRSHSFLNIPPRE